MYNCNKISCLVHTYYQHKQIPLLCRKLMNSHLHCYCFHHHIHRADAGDHLHRFHHRTLFLGSACTLFPSILFEQLLRTFSFVLRSSIYTGISCNRQEISNLHPNYSIYSCFQGDHRNTGNYSDNHSTSLLNSRNTFFIHTCISTLKGWMLACTHHKWQYHCHRKYSLCRYRDEYTGHLGKIHGRKHNKFHSWFSYLDMLYSRNQCFHYK